MTSTIPKPGEKQLAGSDSQQPLDLAGLKPFRDFDSACLATLDYLKNLIAFRLWMITRTHGEDWIVLAARDRLDEIKPGTVFRWSDTLCHRMVNRQRPQFSPDISLVPDYRQAPINEQLPIGAYIGVPIMRADGSLFGTLCAVDDKPCSPIIRDHQHLIEIFAQFLGTTFELENQLTHELRLRERVEAEAMIDELTDVCNRRGWERLLEKEEHRCRRYGHQAGIIVVDLDDLKTINDEKGHYAGDELLKRSARLLRVCCRASDIIARLGGDEFVILAVETSGGQTEKLYGRINFTLADAAISASIGWASRFGDQTIGETMKHADRMMYEHKNMRRQLHDFHEHQKTL